MENYYAQRLYWDYLLGCARTGDVLAIILLILTFICSCLGFAISLLKLINYFRK